MIRRVQTKHKVRPHGLDPTTELIASEAVELIAQTDGARRDVLVKRQGYADFLIYDGNIAGIEVDTILPEFEPHPFLVNEQGQAIGKEVTHVCSVCTKGFSSDRALKGHMARVHR